MTPPADAATSRAMHMPIRPPAADVALSPLAKAGYSNTVPYSHASLLRTLQAIFGVKPYLGAAASANDFSDLFQAGAWK